MPVKKRIDAKEAAAPGKPPALEEHSEKRRTTFGEMIAKWLTGARMVLPVIEGGTHALIWSRNKPQ
ncbi:hypothetical protein [Luteibacter sp.]|uniref:hypothetical protein n=1 Tax=Luteibacter sp. TaxID=1886636 RepID=UPI0025BE062B|nr:hypothetical protein [Luteibacter sp.]